MQSAPRDQAGAQPMSLLCPGQPSVLRMAPFGINVTVQENYFGVLMSVVVVVVVGWPP